MAFRFRYALTTALVAGLALAPLAQARDFRGGGGGHRGGDYRGGRGGFPIGPAVVGGLVGLGIGAAIAGSAPPPVYYGPPAYYGAPPPPAVYYGYGGY